MIAENVAEALAGLKRQAGRDILLSCGSGLLVPLAQAPGLIDQYLIIIHPTVIGSGRSLFGGLDRELPLELVETRVFAGGCVVAYYEPAPA